MSFLNITNPKERDEIVAKYLATAQRIKQRNLRERAQDFLHHEAIEQSLEPVTRTTEASTSAITKELIPIKRGIDRMNANLMHNLQNAAAPVVQQQQPQEEEEEEEEEKEKEEEIKEDPRNAFQKIVEYAKELDIDPYFSIIQNNDGSYQMGNMPIEIRKHDDIEVGGVKFKGTTGLWSLIMFKRPKENTYSEDDLHYYRQLVEMTNVMNYPSNLRSNSNVKGTYKWRNIFQKFNASVHDGDAIQFLPADIKGLHTKLAYLLGEFQAGNTSATRNEIVAISDELLRRKNISQSKYRRINDFIQQQQQR